MWTPVQLIASITISKKKKKAYVDPYTVFYTEVYTSLQFTSALSFWGFVNFEHLNLNNNHIKLLQDLKI